MGVERGARSRFLGLLSRRWVAMGISILLLWGCSAPLPRRLDLPGSLNPGDYLGDRSGDAAHFDGTASLVDLKRLKTSLALPLSSGEAEQPEYQLLLPTQVESKMLAAAAQAQSLPLGQLTVTASRARQWRDSCLGILADQLCAQVITPGWQGIVSDGSRDWVYHSDALGEVVELNASASRTGTRIQLSLAQAIPLDGSLLSLRVSSFMEAEQASSTSTQAVLIDGSVVELDDSGAVVEDSRRGISAGQIQAFDQQRNQAQLAQFDGLRYGEGTSAANQFWVSLVDSQGIVQYDPTAQAQLPPELQAFVLAWDIIACSDPLDDCVAASGAPSEN